LVEEGVKEGSSRAHADQRPVASRGGGAGGGRAAVGSLVPAILRKTSVETSY